MPLTFTRPPVLILSDSPGRPIQWPALNLSGSYTFESLHVCNVARFEPSSERVIHCGDPWSWLGRYLRWRFCRYSQFDGLDAGWFQRLYNHRPLAKRTKAGSDSSPLPATNAIWRYGIDLYFPWLRITAVWLLRPISQRVYTSLPHHT